MTGQEVRDELMTAIAAGHETTAAALAWAFERILCDPGVLERAVAEVDAGKLEYVEAIVKETLRLHPIIPVVGRFLTAPFELGGYTLPAGASVWPCMHMLHRRADLYPEPERFFPDRWLGAKVDPYAWLPFGGSGRRCIRMGFALQEMKVILATVLANARLRKASPEPEGVARRAVTLVPDRGARVVIAREVRGRGAG